MSKAFIVIGLLYGDEGKGQVVEHLTREHGAHTVMRFSGGAQAAHNVIAPDGRHHTFAQFGSGTFAGADTYLGRDMMINPLDMFNEYYHLATLGETDVWDRLSVNKGCLVTTPVHEAANLLKEYYRRGRAHGTTGKGIGETRRVIGEGGLMLHAGELADKQTTRKRLEKLIAFYGVEQDRWVDHQHPPDDTANWSDRLEAARLLLYGEKPASVEAWVDRYAEWAARTRLVDNVHLSNLLRNSGTVVLEGSQGVLLDEAVGFHPHTTWSDVTPGPARSELMIAGLDSTDVETVGVVRSYTTRHGAGPFPSDANRRRPYESRDFAAKGNRLWWEEPHNAPNEREIHPKYEFGTAGEFRRSPFDAVAFRYAVGRTRPDSIAVTHLDAFSGDAWPVVESYEYFGDDGIGRYLSTGESGEVTGIKGGDISHMECVTRRLFDCYPNVGEIELTQEPREVPYDIVNVIQAAGNVPVTIVGEGPSSYRTLKPVKV
jgi:adenylosuccinate synthase